jgi:tRNA (guanine37-N1)-methyltransferase
MVMKPEPVFARLRAFWGHRQAAGDHALASRQLFNQTIARELATYEHLALLCGRYEGFDERIRQHWQPG